MKPSISFLDHLQHFQHRVDGCMKHFAAFLNKKAVAIPLTALRWIFFAYVLISVLVFTYLLFYGDQILNEPAPASLKVPTSIQHLPNFKK